jgi:hypothetical protein
MRVVIINSPAARAGLNPGAAIYGHAAIGGALGAPVSCGEVGKPEALKGFMANLFRDEGGEAVTRPGKSGRNGIFRVCKAGKARLHGLRKGTQKRFWQDHPMGDIAPGCVEMRPCFCRSIRRPRHHRPVGQ